MIVWQEDQLVWSDDAWYEDSGCALIISFTGDKRRNEDEGFFVRLQSWAEDPQSHMHDLAQSLIGNRIRVTIEILEG